MRRARILFLTHRLPYAPNRGDRVRSHYLVRSLAEHHDVHVVSLVHDDEEASHVGELEPFVASVTVARVPRLRNVATALPALLSRQPLTHVLLHSPKIHSVLSASVRGVRPDLVVAFCSSMARYATSRST